MKTQILGSLFATAAAFALVAAPSGANADEITMATWGGSFGKAFQKHWTGPFEAATGTKVNLIFGGSATNKQKVAAEQASPKIDVLTMVTGDAIDAYQRGLTVALDKGKIPNLSQLRDLAIKKGDDGGILGAGLWVTALGIAYRTDKVTWDMKKWTDLSDSRLKNKVGLPSPKYSNAHFVWWSNQLAGGSPQDISMGMKWLKGLGTNVILEFDGSVQVLKQMAQGEIWAAPMLDVTASRIKGVPYRFFVPAEGGSAGVDVIAQVKNSPNPAGAMKFINFIIDSKPAGAICGELKVKCVNKNAKASGSLVSDADVDRLMPPPEAIINAKKGEWLETWAKEITPLSKR
jgi:putative spermidine/putrescine transport system substrate-binding protein